MPMSDLSRATAVPGGAPPTPAAGTQQHPSTFAPATFVLLVILCLFGAAIGVQLILQLGIPASGAWPPGVAAGEAIRAGDAGGKRAALLVVGLLIGIAGSWLKIPMSAFGVAFIGNVWALTMFGIGLLIRGYAMPVAGIDIAKLYVPHGAMVGAGLVALIQVALLIARRDPAGQKVGDAIAAATDDRRM